MTGLQFNSFKNLIKVNDIDFYYETYGQGTPLLLLHGFTGSGQALLPMFAELGKNHLLIIPDLRGHGKSTNPSGVFTHRQTALDLFALLDHLKIESCSALGFSAGANCLLHMAIQQPKRVAAMALVSATPYFPEEARTFMRLFDIEDRTEAEWEAMRHIHVQGDEQIRQLWLQAKAFGDSYKDMNLTLSELTKIKAKTLIVQGDRDPFYPIEISVEMYRHIPDSSLWVLPGGGHVPIAGDAVQQLISYLINLTQVK